MTRFFYRGRGACFFRLVRGLCIAAVAVAALFCISYVLYNDLSAPKTMALWHVNRGDLRPIDRSQATAVVLRAPWQEGEPLEPEIQALDQADAETFLDLLDSLGLGTGEWGYGPRDFVLGADVNTVFGVDFADGSRLVLKFPGHIVFGAEGNEAWKIEYKDPGFDYDSAWTETCRRTNTVQAFYSEMVEKYYPDYVPPMYPY